MGLTPRQLAETAAFVIGGCLAFVDGLPACFFIIGGAIMFGAFVAAVMDGNKGEENNVRADDRK